MLRGLMIDHPLLISSLIEFAARYHGDTEIVTRTVEGPLHRYRYRDSVARARRLAQALTRLGVRPGDRVATLAWNTHRHFELYYGVSGMGAVLHTINPRLFPEQIAYIANHAEDVYLFADLSFAPLLEALAGKLQTVEGIVWLTEKAHLPSSKLANTLCYETLLERESGDFAWPSFDEYAAAALCYTSGTTGNPKGVLYSHRSTVLHSWGVCMPDSLNLSSAEVILPVVPMFHANAWGLAYAAPMCGAKVVLPGAKLDGPSLHELIENERVTFLAGVPTVWLALLNYLNESGKQLKSVKTIVIGGAAAPRSMMDTFQRKFGVRVLHAWGMTEMSPLGVVGCLLPKHSAQDGERQLDVQVKQGRALYGVELKIDDGNGNEQPRDGKAFGHLKVRGPWIADAYFKAEGGRILDADGWFDTGDVATLDADGYMQITDRSKDVIKSGGEWISSIELENLAVGHPEVAEACVIGVPHPKWDERPLLLIVRRPGSSLTREAMLNYFKDRVAKWWWPDDVVFVAQLPHTATGKLLKNKLREEYRHHRLPTV
ncbi:MAG: long-chain-fatty-acid--CoA ligase [Alphaproteobacteria bacterium]|nr:long-chain-fatty-acid--CoA ligase [Alphaproteobacteria bacterium]